MGHYSNQGMILRKLRALLASAPLQQPVQSAACAATPTQRVRKLRPPEIGRLIEAYEAGSCLREVAEQFGVHIDTARNHLKRAGVPRRPYVRKLTDHDVDLAASMYLNGATLASVAERFGVSPETVQKELRRAGVLIRPRRGWKYSD